MTNPFHDEGFLRYRAGSLFQSQRGYKLAHEPPPGWAVVSLVLTGFLLPRRLGAPFLPTVPLLWEAKCSCNLAPEAPVIDAPCPRIQALLLDYSSSFLLPFVSVSPAKLLSPALPEWSCWNENPSPASFSWKTSSGSLLTTPVGIEMTWVLTIFQVLC